MITGSLYITRIPDGTVRFEYYDHKKRVIYSLTASRDLALVEDDASALITPDVDIFELEPWFVSLFR